MLFSSPEKPRTLSLAPPVHLCLSDTMKMYNEFHNAVEGEKLVESGMPANVLLISDPSETTDVQLTLAYGVYGSHDLVILATLPDHISPADLEEDV